MHLFVAALLFALFVMHVSWTRKKRAVDCESGDPFTFNASAHCLMRDSFFKKYTYLDFHGAGAWCIKILCTVHDNGTRNKKISRLAPQEYNDKKRVHFLFDTLDTWFYQGHAKEQLKNHWRH